jgi:hypothetical protein
VDEQINCIADPVEGLSKRPPTEHIRKIINGTLPDNPAFFKIDRDRDKRFIGMVSNGAVRVFDSVTGTEKTVSDLTGSNGYLTTANPRQDITTLTVADYTYVLNRSKNVAKLADTTPARPFEGLLFVRASNYDRNYKVTVRRKDNDGIIAEHTFTTAKADATNASDSIRTTWIAERLAAGITYGLDTVEHDGSNVYISHSVDFKIEVSDDQGGQALKAFKDNIQRFSDLPEKAKEDIVLRIAGDNTSNFDDYYVRFDGTVWEETSKPGTPYRLDADTMPVALIRQPDDTFTLEKLPWVDREAGDDNSVPFPSFVGFPLNSMFYFRNRLGFLADENVILSKAGDYFNFFRTTATQLLDDDPIDVAATDNSGEGSPVSILRHAVAFDKKLALFSDNAQFVLDSKGFLTPFETEVDPVTAFACSPDCQPHLAGRFIYFPFDRDGASGVRQFFIDAVTETEDAQEVTAHVPTYLPANLVSLSGTTLENVMLARSSDVANKLYAYEYFFSGDGQVQSAWGTWEFSNSNTLHFTGFFDNVAYVVTQRTDGFHLERIRLRPDLVDTALDYFSMLDHRVIGITGTYDAINNRTDFTLPYTAPTGITAFTLSNPGVHAPGLEYVPVNVDGTTVSLAGDVSTYSFVFGLKYTQRVDFTQPYYMQSSQNGMVANTRAVVKVRDFAVDYAETGFFDLEFTPRYRDGYTKRFSGQILGATPTDSKSLDDGSFTIKTPCRTKYWGLTLTNDSPFPCTLLAASWRGVVQSKSQRV